MQKSLQWCISNHSIFEELNDPFVSSEQINIDGEDPKYFTGTVYIYIPVPSIRVFNSTRHLYHLYQNISHSSS